MGKTTSTDRPLRQRLPLLFRVAAFVLLLSGCVVPKPPVAFQPGYPSPEAALRALAAASAPPDQAFTATARIEINHRGERYPLKIAVMMKKPAFLRVESIPLLGPPDFFLSVARDELRVYLPGKHAFYCGRAIPENISRFFPLFMPVAEMISLMMGTPPDDQRGASLARQGEEEEVYYRVDGYAAGNRKWSLWIDPAGNRLVRIRMVEGETLLYEASFSEHVAVGDVFIPQRLTIARNDSAEIKLRYTDLRPAVADPESFSLQLPEGMVPTVLDP